MKNQNENRLNEALELAKAGMPLFPLRAGAFAKEEKKPGVKDPLNVATTDEQQITRWFRDTPNGCNFGISVGKVGIVVVDCDNKGGKNGEKHLEALARDAGEQVPPTLKVRTPSGGCHYYFRARGVGSRISAGEGIDIKSCGGYVVAPGSTTSDGEYRVEHEYGIAGLPEWMEKALCSAASGPRQKSPLRKDITPDTEDKIAMAEEIIEQWEYADTGGRNDSLYRLACELCKTGVSPETAMALYAELGEEKIGLPADSGEVERTIRSGYADGDTFGEYSIEARQKAVDMFVDLGVDAKGDHVEDVDWDNDAHFVRWRTPSPDQWHIDDWLPSDPGGIVLFSGDGGIGKSILALKLAEALANGTPFAGMKVNRKRKVIYMTCEDGIDQTTNRMVSFNVDVPEGSMRIWNRRGLVNFMAVPTREHMLARTELVGVLEKRAKAFFGDEGGVLIIDTLSDTFAGNENSKEESSIFLKVILCGLLTRLNASAVVIAHHTKWAAVDGKRYRGSTGWNDGVRARWELTLREEGGGKKLLDLGLAKSNYAEPDTERKITLLMQTGRLSVVNEAFKDEDDKAAVLEEVRRGVDADEPYNKSNASDNSIWKADIKDPFTGITLSEERVREVLKMLEEEGRVASYRENNRRCLVPTQHKLWVERMASREEKSE